MKLFYKKQKLKTIQYRKYKDFSNEAFMHELESSLSRFSQISFQTFKSTVDNILQKHAPIKKRYVQKNQASFMNYKIHKEVMRGTPKPMPTEQPITQRNYCASLIRKEKKSLLQKS